MNDQAVKRFAVLAAAPSSHVIHHSQYSQAHLIRDDPELIKQLRAELAQQSGSNRSI